MIEKTRFFSSCRLSRFICEIFLQQRTVDGKCEARKARTSVGYRVWSICMPARGWLMSAESALDLAWCREQEVHSRKLWHYVAGPEQSLSLLRGRDYL